MLEQTLSLLRREGLQRCTVLLVAPHLPGYKSRNGDWRRLHVVQEEQQVISIRRQQGDSEVQVRRMQVVGRKEGVDARTDRTQQHRLA